MRLHYLKTIGKLIAIAVIVLSFKNTNAQNPTTTLGSMSLILRHNDTTLIPSNDSTSNDIRLNNLLSQFNVKFYRKVFPNNALGTFYGDLFYMTCNDTNGFDTIFIDSLKNIPSIYGVIFLNRNAYQTGCNTPVTVNDDYKDGSGNTLDYLTWKSNWHIKAVDAECGWNFSTGNSKNNIAIIEGSVDLTHQELNGKIPPSIRVPNFSYSNTITGHGTQVFGAAVANTNDGMGIPSVGFTLKATHFENDAGRDQAGNIEPGTIDPLTTCLSVLQAAKQGFKVINCSFTDVFGFKSTPNGLVGDRVAFVTDLVNQGVTLVLASGNGNGTKVDGKYEYTKDIPGVIVVGGIDENYNVNFDPNGSNKMYSIGPHVDIFAPAERLLSLDSRTNSSSPPAYIWCYGTSLAAPMVSATIGLMLDINPNLSPIEIECYLKNNYDPINDKSNYSSNVLTGRLSVYKVLDAVSNDLNAGKYPTTFTINSPNNNWSNTQKIVNQNITIQNGGQLNITDSDIKFAVGKGIIVEQGGKLIINNSLLTNEVSCIPNQNSAYVYSMWSGIKIVSHGLGVSQNINTSGFVDVSNNSIIENARMGFTVGNTNTGGGILRIENSTVKNCRFHIGFDEYVDPVDPDLNLCRFNNVDFITNKKFFEYNLGGLNTSIWMYHISGVKFNGCQWDNSVDLYGGRGIGAWDCKFWVTDGYSTVQGNPCSNRPLGRKSSFKNLNIGIHSVAGNYEKNRLMSISNTFTNCHTGILIGTDKLSEIIDDDFVFNELLVYPKDPNSTPHVNHIYSNTSQAFTIADCKFRFENPNYLQTFSPDYYGIKTINAREGTISVPGSPSRSFRSDINKSSFTAIPSQNNVVGQRFYNTNYNLFMHCNYYNDNLSIAWTGDDQASLNEQEGFNKELFITTTYKGYPGITQLFFTNNKFDPCIGANNSMVGVSGRLFNNYTNPNSSLLFGSTYRYYTESSTIPYYPSSSCNINTVLPSITGKGIRAVTGLSTDRMPICDFNNTNPFYNLDDVFCRNGRVTPLRNDNTLDADPLLPPLNQNDSNYIINNTESDFMIFLSKSGFGYNDLITRNIQLKNYIFSNFSEFSLQEKLFANDILLQWFDSKLIISNLPLKKTNTSSLAPNNLHINTTNLLYPNPNNGKIYISNFHSIGKLVIRSVEGKLITSITLENQESIHLLDLKGIVFFEIFDSNGNFVKTEKLIIQ